MIREEQWPKILAETEAERARLLGIVQALAASNPWYLADLYAEHATFRICNVTIDDMDDSHADGCPWRAAVDYMEQNR